MRYTVYVIALIGALIGAFAGLFGLYQLHGASWWWALLCFVWPLACGAWAITTMQDDRGCSPARWSPVVMSATPQITGPTTPALAAAMLADAERTAATGVVS